MSAHPKARLTFQGRLLLVQRVQAGWSVAHAAKAQGVSRQCAHRWITRFREAGEAGLVDRSSRPRSCSTQTLVDVEQLVIETRVKQRVGQDRIAATIRGCCHNGESDPAAPSDAAAS